MPDVVMATMSWSMQYLRATSPGFTAYFFAKALKISSAGPPANLVTAESGPYAAVAMPCLG